jgi:hypothetical protein
LATLPEYARAHGLLHDQQRTGLVEHEHAARWALDPSEKKPMGSYITVRVHLDCGCVINDLDAFAKQMHAQQGWGWGGSTGSGTYMRVRRKSLDS